MPSTPQQITASRSDAAERNWRARSRWSHIRRHLVLCATMTKAVAIGLCVLPSAHASSLPPEYKSFQSICSYVELAHNPQLEGSFDRQLINKVVGEAIKARLRDRMIEFPVNYGQPCFLAFTSQSREIRFWFYGTLQSVPNETMVAMALTVHGLYRNVQKPLREFPTSLVFCQKPSTSECLAEHVIAYFDVTMLPVLEQAHKVR